MMHSAFEIVHKYGLTPISNVVQVGASGGQEIPMFDQFEVQHAVMIEPLDYPFSILKNNIGGRANYLPVQCAVGAKDGEEVTLFVASNDGQSSSILKPANHLTLYPRISFETKINTNSFTLDTIVASVRANHRTFPEVYDLIYVDVQGAELEVFKGARRCLQAARYIFTEVGFGGGYEKDVSYLRLAQYLDEFNYKLVELNINPQFGYGDAFFMRMG